MAGNLTSRSYPGGVATTYGYDGDNRLASAVNASLTTSYGYDACAGSLGFETTALADPRRDASLVYQNAVQLEKLYYGGGPALLLGLAICLAPPGVLA